MKIKDVVNAQVTWSEKPVIAIIKSIDSGRLIVTVAKKGICGFPSSCVYSSHGANLGKAVCRAEEAEVSSITLINRDTYSELIRYAEDLEEEYNVSDVIDSVNADIIQLQDEAILMCITTGDEFTVEAYELEGKTLYDAVDLLSIIDDRVMITYIDAYGINHISMGNGIMPVVTMSAVVETANICYDSTVRIYIVDITLTK